MTTYELMREGEWSRDGRLITPGTITWRDEMIPVIDNDRHRLGTIIGAVTNLRREGNRIYGDTDVKMPKGYLLTVDCDNYDLANTHEVEPGKVEMSDLRIRAAHISHPESYPWDVDT